MTSLILASSDAEVEEEEEPVSRPGIGARLHQPPAQTTSPVNVITNPSPQLQPAVASSHTNGKRGHRSGDNEDPADSKVTKRRRISGSSVPTAVADNGAKSNEEGALNLIQEK